MHKKRAKNICLFLACCAFHLPAFTQDFTFLRYSPAEGLAAEVVFDVMEDSYGFLWAGTSNGLSRFDGKTFKNFGYTEGLQDLAVVTIYEDSHHRLWAGTMKGIAELKSNHFIMHSNSGHEVFFVNSFSEIDPLGLLAFTSKGTYRYNDSTWTKINLFPGTNAGQCLKMVAGDDGLYMSYEEAVFFKKKDSPLVLLARDTTSKAEIFCSQLTRQHGKVYAAIHNQLFELSGGKMHLLIDSILAQHFFNYAIDTNHIIWVNISGKGLYKYQLLPQQQKTVSVYRYDSHTAGYPFIDNQQNLWICSYEGLIKAIPKIYEDITPPKKAGSSKRLNIISAGDNELLMSDITGLHLLKNNKIIDFDNPVSYKDETSYHQDNVEGFAKDSRNFTWVITRQRHLLCWNGTALLDYSHNLVSRAAEYIRDAAVNIVNNKVFICDDSTLLCGNENRFEEYKDANGKTFSKTTSILFTHSGIGIVNVSSKGIYFITKKNEIIKAPQELEIIDKGSYTYFFEDKEGWIWISNAGKGLVRFRIDENDYRVKKLSLLTTEQGLPSNKIADMMFDSEGNKWVSCINGLVVLKNNPSDNSVLDVYSIGKEQNINLAAPVGMATDNIGNVWLASLDKLIKLDAHKLILKKVQPSVVIEKVLLDMKETNWAAYSDAVLGYYSLPLSAKLNYSQNTLGIQFLGTSLYNADYFEYSYLLEPSEKTWSHPSSNNFISLIKLSPGKYTFKVKARGPGTNWSEPAVFNFTITPPFWESWLFRLLLIFSAAALIVAIYRNRVKKIHAQTAMQNQLRELEMKALKAQMNPHFIYNAMNSIQSLIADEKKMDAINYVGTFSRLLRQVLDYADTNIITLDNELQTLRLYIELESLRMNIDLHYTIRTDEELIPENEKVPPLILQPFVENALWHGLSRKEGSKLLDIFVSQNGTGLICTIEDNGIGRVNAMAFKKQSVTEIYSSKGIDITRKRLINFNNSTQSPIVYNDLYDAEGNPAGTRVIIIIRRQMS